MPYALRYDVTYILQRAWLEKSVSQKESLNFEEHNQQNSTN